MRYARDYFFLTRELVKEGGFPAKIVIPLIVVSVIAILLTLGFFFMNKKQDLSSLPYEVRWFYERYQKKPRVWEKIGNASKVVMYLPS